MDERGDEFEGRMREILERGCRWGGAVGPTSCRVAPGPADSRAKTGGR